MEAMKSLCVKIPILLHQRIREAQEARGMNLNEYMMEVLTEYLEKEENEMKEEKTRTLAVQIPEELFEQWKEHLKKKGKNQRQYLMELMKLEIEKA